MKKNILKIFGIFVFAFLAGSLLFLKVNASSLPYIWVVDGEELWLGETNKAGTATTLIDNENKIVKLILNNYKGNSNIHAECRGTGLSGVRYVIELIGDNEINVLDDIAIGTMDSAVDYEFVGTGNLIINAPTPISYKDYNNYLYISPSENVLTSEKEQNNNNEISGHETENQAISKEKVKNNNFKEEKQNKNILKINKYILYSLIGILIILLVIIIILVKKSQKNKDDIKN